MLARVARAFAVLAMAAAAATGCVGSPEPRGTTPTPLTDEQAFAAAEETYRAYVDALNQVDLSDPTTFEPVYALTTGELNSQDRRNFSEWQAEGISIEGEARVSKMMRITVSPTHTPLNVLLEACYDVSAIDVRAADGTSLVDATRPPMQPLRIAVETGTAAAARISSITPAEDIAC